MTPTTPSWRLDRSINVGDLLVFISLLAAGIGYVIHQDQRSTRTEDAVVSLKDTDQRHDKDIQTLKGDMTQRLDRMDAKLDRLIERR